MDSAPYLPIMKWMQRVRLSACRVRLEVRDRESIPLELAGRVAAKLYPAALSVQKIL